MIWLMHLIYFRNDSDRKNVRYKTTKLNTSLTNCVDVASKAYQLLNKIMWKIMLYTVYLADVCGAIGRVYACMCVP